MPFRFAPNISYPVLGNAAYGAGYGVSRRENVVRSLEANQQQQMQAAALAASMDQQAAQLQDHERSRLYDLHRSVYQTNADFAQRKMLADQHQGQFEAGQAADVWRVNQQGEQQAQHDARVADAQDIASNRDFNERRLLSRQEWVDKGIKSGELRFSDRDKAERQKKYDELAAVRSSRILTPAERLKAESQIVSQIESIEPSPVPPDERPVPNHEAMNANTTWFDGKSWNPIGQRELTPGDVYRIPDGKGGFEKGVWKEKEYEASLKPPEDPTHETRHDFALRRKVARELISKEKTKPDAESAYSPSNEEVDAYLNDEDAAYARRYKKPEDGTNADPLGAAPVANVGAPAAAPPQAPPSIGPAAAPVQLPPSTPEQVAQDQSAHDTITAALKPFAAKIPVLAEAIKTIDDLAAKHGHNELPKDAQEKAQKAGDVINEFYHSKDAPKSLPSKKEQAVVGRVYVAQTPNGKMNVMWNGEKFIPIATYREF